MSSIIVVSLALWLCASVSILPKWMGIKSLKGLFTDNRLAFILTANVLLTFIALQRFM